MPESREKHVYDVFGSIADGYDRANLRISLGRHLAWKRKAVELLDVRTDGTYLDAGCGTGDMLRLIRRAAPESMLAGVDISPEMLRVAAGRLEPDCMLSLINGSVLSLPFEDACFDGAVISFALRNTSDFKRALCELARVVKPGGRVVCIDSFVPEKRWVRPFYSLYFSAYMPLLGGGLKKREEYRWLNRSTREFPPASELAGLMSRCGLRPAARKDFMMGACVCLCAVREGGG